MPYPSSERRPHHPLHFGFPAPLPGRPFYRINLIRFALPLALQAALCLLLFLSSTLEIQAQSESPRRPSYELQLISENDVYLFDLTDQYYSNGFQLHLRKLLPNHSPLPHDRQEKKPLIRKAIVHLTINQSIYTPSKIFSWSIDKIDRPYAGWLSLGSGLSLFLRDRTVLAGELEVGVTGPWSGAERTQKGWHSFFGMDKPRNWDYQIRNAVTTHASVLLQRQIISKASFDLISQTALLAGSTLNHAQQGVFIRLGRLGPIHHSIFTHSRLDHTLPDADITRKEFYFFAGASLERVFTNGLIDGRLMDDLELVRGKSLPWLQRYQWGASYGNRLAEATLAIHHLSPEFQGGKNHSYASIEIAVRF
jgi:lipid A 3-O-deacylase